MERTYDFVKRLDGDVSLKILMCLDDPKDVAKLEAVSNVWLRFVVENGLQKKLCLKLCPEVSKIVDVESIDEGWYRMLKPRIPEELVREHRVFTFLSCGLLYWLPERCRKNLICASGSEIPRKDESLEDDDYSDVEEEIRYWFDEGTSDPTTPVILVYELLDKLGVISDVLLTPRQGCGSLFSAKAVRFSMGHRKHPLIPERTSRYKRVPDYDDDMFTWTYTSPEFPMAQEYKLQQFQLGRPVLCMGGILKVEMLERINKGHNDLTYCSKCSWDGIKVFGRSLGQEFEIDRVDGAGNCILKCHVLSADELEHYPSPMTDETFRRAHYEDLIEYL